MKNHNRGYESDTEAVDAVGWAKKKTGVVSRIASWVIRPAQKKTQGGLRIGAQITSFNFPNTPVRRDSSSAMSRRR
jgi:hypothetical protein